MGAGLDVRHVAETGSTNDDVAALARAGAGEGLWLSAGVQAAGRGRLRRAWLSPPGNLHASTLVRLRPGDPAASDLAFVAGIALDAAAAARTGEDAVRLKWPNDLMAGHAKLAGMLIEREGDAVVIGIGVNLAHAPPVPDRPVTSLAALTGAAPDRDAFLHALAHAFAGWLARWRAEGFAPVRARWLARAHPVGTPLRVAAGEGAIDGRFDGLDRSGALRLRLADGALHVMHAGDVFLL